MAQRGATKTMTSQVLLSPYQGKKYYPLLAHAYDCQGAGGAEAIGLIKGEIFENIVRGLSVDELIEANEALKDVGLSEYVELSAAIAVHPATV